MLSRCFEPVRDQDDGLGVLNDKRLHQGKNTEENAKDVFLKHFRAVTYLYDSMAFLKRPPQKKGGKKRYSFDITLNLKLIITKWFSALATQISQKLRRKEYSCAWKSDVLVQNCSDSHVWIAPRDITASGRCKR